MATHNCAKEILEDVVREMRGASGTSTSFRRLRITSSICKNYRLALAVIIALHFLLATWYSFAIPPWEATDEEAHFGYALFLRDQRRLPVQSQDPAKIDNVMAHHPPLYYAVLALVATPFDTSDHGRVLRPNRAFIWGSVRIGGPFAFIHDEETERFPYRGTLLVLHIFRLISVLAGAITVFASFNVVRLFMNRDHWLVITSTAAVAFLPSFLFTSATVHNDIFVTMFFMLATWQALRTIELGPTTKRHVLLGLLLAAAVLSKASGMILLVLPLIVVGAHIVRTGQTYRAISGLIITLITFAVTAGWWFVRNQLLYGEPLGLSVFETNPMFPIRTAPAPLGVILEELRPPQNLLFRTFILAFGYMDHYGPAVLYDVAWLVILIGLIGLVYSIIRHLSNAVRFMCDPKSWVAASVVVLLGASLVRYMMGFRGGGHGRYLFPALPFLVLPVFFGLGSFLRGRFASLPALAVCGGLMVLAFAFPPLIMAPTYAIAGKIGGEQAASRPIAEFGSSIQLLDAVVKPLSVKPGETITVTLRWRALKRMDENYLSFITILDTENRVIVQDDSTPVAGRAPTSMWKPGEAFEHTVSLQLPADQRMGLYRVETGFYQRPSLERLIPDTGSLSRSVIIGMIKVPNSTIQTLVDGKRFDVPFGDAIRLLEAKVPTSLARGQQLPVAFLWRAVASMEKDYTLSIQLLGPDGTLVSQRDLQPQNGNYPTSVWEAGELVPDSIDLAVPASLQRGHYRLIAVLYDRPTGQRLRTPMGGFAELAQFDLAD